ncbi:fumarylacetoacetase [Dyella sp.]|uniref:fumarylacetoacetase n=1 Tax=Dyella sp. TaxID=1869338 RepID=UPI002ED3BD0A
MIELDATHDPARRSWVDSANDGTTDFPIQNLPLGIFSLDGHERRFGIAVGDVILDVGYAHARGWLAGDAGEAARLGQAGSLNALLAAGQAPLRALRRQVSWLLDVQQVARDVREAAHHGLLHERSRCTMHLPVRVGNYTDFYAGIYHARAAGALLTPENPLPANYTWVPIGYHGRASSVSVGQGQAIRRPLGQRPPRSPGEAPDVGPCQRLDFELEMGFYVGAGNAQGQPIPMRQAHEHIAGYCLLNDWSARDIQRWEMFPLGPFLSKNFGTMVSPWIVTADALAPFRVPAMPREPDLPAPLPYLTDASDQAHGGLDVQLSVSLQTAVMRQHGIDSIEILRSNARHLYWTPAQMLAHHSSGGCNMEPGDLLGTGTISGPLPEQLSSLLELTHGGTRPVRLPHGEQRGFLEDGDEITFQGRCAREGFASLGFGQVRGVVGA